MKEHVEKLISQYIPDGIFADKEIIIASPYALRDKILNLMNTKEEAVLSSGLIDDINSLIGDADTMSSDLSSVKDAMERVIKGKK